jgi:hypothetical protein
MKVKETILRGSIQKWAHDHVELAHLAPVLQRAVERDTKPQFPALTTNELLGLLASTFRLAHRLHNPRLQTFWLNAGIAAYEKEISPVLDYAKNFSIRDNEAPRTRRGRKPLPETSGNGPEPLRPRSYAAEETL